MPYMGIQDMKESEIKRGSATGDGSTVAYAIGWTPPSEQSMFITINGVTQQDAAYTVSASTLTFAAAPASADAIEWRGIQSAGTIITPADGSVQEAKLGDYAVTGAKYGSPIFVDTSTDYFGIAAASFTPDAQLHITKSSLAEVGTVSYNATTTLDLKANQNFVITLTGNITFANPSTAVAGMGGCIFIVQDGTGSRTASWNGYWKWIGGTAPTLTTTAAAIDRVDYIVKSSTEIQAVASLDIK